MLTVTVREIVESAKLLQELTNTARGKKFSARIGRYVGVHVFDAVGKVFTEFHKTRDELIKAYGHMNAGGIAEVPAEKVAEFSATIAVLLDEKRDLPNLYKVRESDLEAAELSPAEWRALNWLLLDAETV